MEIDPSGHVMDYSASYYRKFDYEWNFKSLEICSIKDEKGYIVAGRLSVSELLELGIDLEEFYMGVFRADFTTPNTVIWYSSVSIFCMNTRNFICIIFLIVFFIVFFIVFLIIFSIILLFF